MDSTENKTQNQPTLFTKKQKKTCRVYIDGFNLYHGAIKGTSHKWLDLQKYFRLLRPDENVVQVNYFTAMMHGPQGVRQAAYLAALATTPTVNVVLGKYKTKRVYCNVPSCIHAGDRRFATWEEKRTDVNIAIKLLDDAYQNKADVFVVISGDSDLVSAFHQVKHRFPKKTIAVYIPARDPVRGAAVEIRAAADKHKTLPQALLQHSHFAATLPDGDGGTITKPPEW